MSCNFPPLVTDIELDENGYFDGQKGYGYGSLEKFIDAAMLVSNGKAKAEDFEGKGLPTIKAVYVYFPAAWKKADEKAS